MTTASVIIPTHGRPEKLNTCLDALAQQRLEPGDTMEIIVAEDGAVATAGDQLVTASGNVSRLRLPRIGVSAARNAAIRRAAGEFLLFVNDDCYPDVHWAARHIAAQRRSDSPALVVGRTDWMPWPDMTVFDHLVRDTSMIFFYDTMTDGERYGFRHFWTCNASAPASLVRAIGGFDERIRPYLFDDVEFAWRADQATGDGVRYEASARATHDHRVSWSDYLEREHCLGRMAACLAEVNPECFCAIFGDDDADQMRRDFETWLAIDGGDHARVEAQLAEVVAAPVPNERSWPLLRASLYAAHLPVKRRQFRQGFVDGFDLRGAEQWETRLQLENAAP